MRLASYPAYRTSRIEWVKKAPVDWEECSAKINYLMQLGKMLQNDPSGLEDVEIAYLKALHVNWNRVTTEDLPKMWASPSDLEQYAVSNGDLLVCEGGEVGRAAILKGLEEPAIIQNALHRIRGTERGEVRYFGYLLKHIADAGWFDILCNKATIAHLTGEKLGAIYMPVPTVREQQQITAFLDWKTGQIDALIRKKQDLLEKLKEKRLAVITQAVTRGLDLAVAMRDSGIPWLGQVPQHWEVKKLSRVTKSRCDGPFGSGLKSEHYTDEGVRVIRLQNIEFAEFDNEDRVFIDPEYYTELGDHDVYPGDLLVAGLGDTNNPVGRACKAPDNLGPAMVKADCFRYRFEEGKADGQFMAYQMSITAMALAGALASGVTRPRMNLSLTSDRVLAFPPIKEQIEIAAFLDRKSEEARRMTMKVNLAITRLTEYRTALIAAATTGKIDVRNVTIADPSGS